MNNNLEYKKTNIFFILSNFADQLSISCFILPLNNDFHHIQIEEVLFFIVNKLHEKTRKDK